MKPHENEKSPRSPQKSKAFHSESIAEPDDPRMLALSLARFLDQKKAADVILMDLRKANPYFCYFLIATANSQMQLKSIVREILKNFGSALPAKHSVRAEDFDSGWIVLDFVDVVVHLFLEAERNYYNLERLWGDAPQMICGDSKLA